VPLITEKIGGITFREFSKSDISEHKERLLQLWRNLANHLRESPTYYNGVEFTDAAYWEHVNNDNTRLFTALDSRRNIIGIVDTSHDEFCFAWSDPATLNVGDLYVEPAYRGKRVAQGLVQYASDVLLKDNFKRLWVMHGTGNPNALRFWSKYFTGFVYQLTRSIDSRIIDLPRG
jgi:GNAT superfamily N-acetyltransferase